MCDQDRESFIGHTGRLLRLRREFRVCEHGMPCALEINSNDGFKRKYVEYCPSTKTSITSPQTQCLWPPNLAGW